MIVWVSVVLRRTVCGDIDRRFDNLSGSHHPKQGKVSTIVVGMTILNWERLLVFETL